MVFVATGDTINITLNNKVYVCQKSHPNFDVIKAKLKVPDMKDDEMLALIDMKKSIETFSKGKVKIDGEKLFYDGRELANCFTRRIIEMIKEQYNIDPLLKFLDNLMLNPSYTAVNEFYGFLDRNKLPMTDDGCFLAYKKVRWDYMDIYTGKTHSNTVGEKPEMPRNFVDDDSRDTCSYGLHFASIDYMPHYSSNDIDDHIMIVKINPRDVVAFPSDFSGSKGRCCMYEVVDEITDKNPEIKSYFRTTKDYAQVSKILSDIKTLINSYGTEEKKIDSKYPSNLSGLGLNNFAIREVLDSVKSKYSISVDLVYDSLESITVKNIVQYILDETK